MDTQESPPPLPPLIQTPVTRPDINYTSLFNQLFANTLEVQCICKTASRTEDGRKREHTKSKSSSNIFDHKFDDFMEDDDETNDTSVDGQIVTTSSSNNEAERICDLTCFEIMKYTHYSLKNCLSDENETTTIDECWQTTIKSIAPLSCDYNGTTLFHLAACDPSGVKLLRYELTKCPMGVWCTDAKGMTPLMRAVQRNNIESVEYLLNETESDINGNQISIYTPLWLSVSNGLDQMCLLLLDMNASTRYVNKMAPASTSLLLSPLRASIVYSKYQIMKQLLEYDADVSEIFMDNTADTSNSSSSSSYLSGLKLYYRHFGAHRNDMYLKLIHSYTPSPNIYKHMLTALLKSIGNQLTRFAAELTLNGLDYQEYLKLIDDTTTMEMSLFLSHVVKFIHSVDEYLAETARPNTFAIYPGYSQLDLLRFVVTDLVQPYFKPLSLKELARFKFRKMLFERVNQLPASCFNTSVGRGRKVDHIHSIVDKLGLPNYFKEYTLRFNTSSF